MIDDVVHAIASAVAAHAGPGPFVVGLAGGVGVGKTTLAHELSRRLTPQGLSVAVLATDNFLFPNAELERRGWLMQKGFPHTYDVERLAAAVRALRSGSPVKVPVYDHQTYDVLDEERDIGPGDVLLLEGVNVLQPAVLGLLDLAAYIDVDEEHARGWFFSRFDELSRRGEGFYAPFASMPREQRDVIAEAAWSSINLVNLREHIAPTKACAHLVIRKDVDHAVVDVIRQGRRT